MLKFQFVLILFLGISSKNVQCAKEVLIPRDLGSFSLPNAGFIEVFAKDDPTGTYADQYTLFISTFNYLALFQKDSVFKLTSPGNFLDDVANWNSRLEQMGGENTAYWPNTPTRLGKEIAGFNGMIQTSGFLVPSKTYGQLEVYNLDSGEGPWNMASDVSGKDWSYHFVSWIDVDGDGLQDAMTARFHVGTFGGTTSQLIYLRNPGGVSAEPASWENWEETVLIEGGPDVNFEMTTMNDDLGKEYAVLVAGELWSERIMLYYVENVPGAWLDQSNIKSVVIDQNPGQPFEASIVDANADGRFEILASAYDKDGKVGNLFVYLMPEDWTSPNWQRETVATGFKANNYLFGNSMTPGKHRMFYPSREYSEGTTESGLPVKPYISLSGDDDGKHYILYPNSEDKNDWTYDMRLLIETGETTSGTMAVVDLDGDGYTEIISAGYSAGKVYVHTFGPEKEN